MLKIFSCAYWPSLWKDVYSGLLPIWGQIVCFDDGAVSMPDDKETVLYSLGPIIWKLDKMIDLQGYTFPVKK